MGTADKKYSLGTVVKDSVVHILAKNSYQK